MQVNEHPSVFISYSHNDSAIVESVGEILRARGVDVWLDKWKLQVGDSLVSEVERAIASSRNLVLFISKNSANSCWVKEEYESAKALNLEGCSSIRILPARLDDTPIPIFLASRKYADFRSSLAMGMAALLNAILDPTSITSIDKVFATVADRLTRDKTALVLKEPLGPDLDRTLSELLASRRKQVFDSAITVGVYGNSLAHGMDRPSSFFSEPDFAYLVKWLTNSARDLAQCRIYEAATDIIKNGSRRSGGIPLTVVLDSVFQSQVDHMRNLGMTQGRGAMESVANDIDRLFSVLLEHAFPGRESDG